MLMKLALMYVYNKKQTAERMQTIAWAKGWVIANG
jgi:hypothetical protein